MSSESNCEVRCLHPQAVQRAVAVLNAESFLLDISALFNALGDPTRLRLLLALSAERLCTCDLAVVLGVTESAVSHQLRVLKELDLVQSERQNKMMFHHLTGHVVSALTEIASRQLEETHKRINAA